MEPYIKPLFHNWRYPAKNIHNYNEKKRGQRIFLSKTPIGKNSTLGSPMIKMDKLADWKECQIQDLHSNLKPFLHNTTRPSAPIS